MQFARTQTYKEKKMPSVSMLATTLAKGMMIYLFKLSKIWTDVDLNNKKEVLPAFTYFQMIL